MHKTRRALELNETIHTNKTIRTTTNPVKIAMHMETSWANQSANEIFVC